MHKLKWMTYQGEKVRIDREIAPLLAKMWELGIKTQSCCQAHCKYSCKHKCTAEKLESGTISFTISKDSKDCKQYVWILFHSMADYEKLLNVVAEYDQGWHSMYAQITGSAGHNQGVRWVRHPDNWEMSPTHHNDGAYGHWGSETEDGETFECWNEDGCKKNKFRIQPHLYFPRKHLPYVEEKLQLVINKRAK